MNLLTDNILVINKDKAGYLPLIEPAKKVGSRLCEVDSGSDAVKLINKFQFDGIFLDTSIDDIAPKDLLKTIRKEPYHAKTPVFITGTPEELQVIEKLFEMDAIDFMYKPVDQFSLKSKLKQIKKLNHLLSQEKSKVSRLNEKLQQFIDLYKYAPLPMIMVNENSNILEHNLKAEELFNSRDDRPIGAMTNEALGTTNPEAVNQEKSDLQLIINDTLNSGKPIHKRIIEFDIQKNSYTKHLIMSISTIPFGENKKHAILIFEDISKDKYYMEHM